MATTTPWMLTALALTAGLSLALFTWVLAQLIAAVPRQDRTWLDRPPAAYRLLWWPVQWFAHYLAPALSSTQQTGLRRRLIAAGLDFALTPAQFIAGQLLWGLIAAAFAVWLAASFALGGLWPAILGGAAGFFLPALWLKDRIEARRRQTLKDLPFMLDLITLCVESGLNLTGAFSQAVDKGPAGALRDEFARLLRDVRAGRPRAEALKELAARLDMPPVAAFVASLIQAESSGMSLGPILRAQAEQRRVERFARAERLAMQAPVKLLLPLLAFIFPCVFLILLFPIAMKFLMAGF